MICKKCGDKIIVENGLKYCNTCKKSISKEDIILEENETFPVVEETEELNEEEKGNVIAGSLGAIFFSLGGIVFIIIASMLGYVMALSGVVTYFLASLGYKSFSKSKANYTLKKIICALVTSVVILVGGYFGLRVGTAFQCQSQLETYGYNYSFTYVYEELLPNVLSQSSEVKEEYNESLIELYIFGFIGMVAEIFAPTRFGKSRRKQVNNSNQTTYINNANNQDDKELSNLITKLETDNNTANQDAKNSCIHCGNPLIQGNKFCTYCGKQIE